SEGIATTRRTRTPNATRVRSRLGIFFHLPARLVVLQRDQELLERHDRLLPCRCLRLRAEQRQGCLGQSSDDGGGLAGVDDRPTGALHLLRKHFLLVVEPVGGADDQHVQDADRDDGDEDERDVRGPREVVEPLDDPLDERSHAPSIGSSVWCLPPNRNPLMVIITGLIAVRTAYSWVARLTRMAIIQTAQMPKAKRIFSRSVRSRSSCLERFAVELDRLGIKCPLSAVIE